MKKITTTVIALLLLLSLLTFVLVSCSDETVESTDALSGAQPTALVVEATNTTGITAQTSTATAVPLTSSCE